MNINMVLGWQASSLLLHAIKSVGEKYDVLFNIISKSDHQELKPHMADAEIYGSWGRQADAELIEYGVNLRWIQLLTSGTENFIKNINENDGICLTNAKGIHVVSMAEHIMALLLAVNRRIFSIYDNQKKQLWRTIPAHELHQKTVVIWGFGSVGIEVAKRLKPFGSRVIGIKKSLTQNEYVDKLYLPDEWQAAIREADVLISLLPGTPDTECIINKSVFELLPSHAIFMNFGRGMVVDETDLIDALDKRKIRRAILDVFNQEPLSSDSSLWKVKNLIISPHMASMSPNYMDRSINLFLENLELYLKKEKLKNIVNINKGY
ncbi:MAG: D-2-hydroxyacid dehydrogenase [Halanaerobiales bacterium]|nr:D-2-hydroxyacid dehydrogenase [Halanaerobiales bacterium]